MSSARVNFTRIVIVGVVDAYQTESFVYVLRRVYISEEKYFQHKENLK